MDQEAKEEPEILKDTYQQTKKLINKSDKTASEAVDWVAVQYELRKKKNKISKAKRELKFIEHFQQTRKKYLVKKQIKTIEGMSAAHFVSTRTSNRSDSKAAVFEKSQATTDATVDDNLATYVNDDFAPNSDSDSDWVDEDDNLVKEEPEFVPLKVIFASRTHSQLSQFINELKKTDFATRLTSVTLGSRQNMCINPDVSRLNSLSLINERCLDLQKKGKGTKTSETKKLKSCGGCQFLNHSGIEELKRHILSQPIDIEDLVTISRKEFNACPYYGSRKAAEEAQLILLPYNTILHSGTRKAINLKVENSVLLLDEAHNIIESISNMYSTSVSESQLQECITGLKTYIKRYMSRFKPKNLLRLKQIEFIIKSFHNYLGNSEPNTQRVFETRQFKSEVGIEQLDIFDLIKFINKSKLVYKVKGYLQLQENQLQEQKNPTSNRKIEQNSLVLKKLTPGQSFLNFSAFIKSINSAGWNGRVIQDDKTFKFLLLDPNEDFSSLVSLSRSIILAGGTMKPYTDIEDQLFQSAQERITHFSCSHVIPKENLVCLALSHGPTSQSLDFTFKNRNSPLLLEELSRIVFNIGKVVPGGLILFLPSYDYSTTFYEHLKDSGSLEKIEQKKKVFRETKESSDKVLNEYSRQIRNNSGGAILLAIVGGKLSEGINFADDLGRCVIVVGLPYPNITSVEIKEKINFISNRFGSEKAKQFLPNTCFKAVNQSIGRSIRHSNDYSAILLLDYRFLRKESQSLLPEWIFNSYTSCTKFGHSYAILAKFFSSKQSN